MSALGLSCNVRKGRIVARGVLLSNGSAAEAFHHAVAADEDLALQLRSISDSLATRLQDLDVTSIVVRSADYHPATRLKEHVALRLRGEGVLLSTARVYVQQVRCLNGRDIGDECSASKEEVDRRAVSLLSEEWREATAAAIAAESLLRNGAQG